MLRFLLNSESGSSNLHSGLALHRLPPAMCSQAVLLLRLQQQVVLHPARVSGRPCTRITVGRSAIATPVVLWSYEPMTRVLRHSRQARWGINVGTQIGVRLSSGLSAQNPVAAASESTCARVPTVVGGN